MLLVSAHAIISNIPLSLSAALLQQYNNILKLWLLVLVPPQDFKGPHLAPPDETVVEAPLEVGDGLVSPPPHPSCCLLSVHCDVFPLQYSSPRRPCLCLLRIRCNVINIFIITPRRVTSAAPLSFLALCDPSSLAWEPTWPLAGTLREPGASSLRRKRLKNEAQGGVAIVCVLTLLIHVCCKNST